MSFASNKLKMYTVRSDVSATSSVSNTDADSSTASQSTAVEDPRSQAEQCWSSKATPRFSAAEEQRLRLVVEKVGKDWAEAARYFPGIAPETLEKRWRKICGAEGRHRPWTEAEDAILQTLSNQFRRDWKSISKRLKGRTPDEVKSRYYFLLQPSKPCEPMQTDPALDLSQLIVSPSAEECEELSSKGEKLERIHQLRSALSSLETILNSTKGEISKIEAELRMKTE